MALTQHEKAMAFQALHEGPEAFLIPNPWDAGSARILAGLGFRALATSSAASAAVLGRRDGHVTLEECLAHARIISGATDLPVSGDLENGFGDSPESVEGVIRQAADAGLCGASIEDATRHPGNPLYDFNHAVDRVAAATGAARKLPFRFMVTARAENFVRGQPDLEDTARRLVAFEKAGADVLFAPGLPDLAAVRAVCAAVSRPVNFMVGARGKSFTVAELAAAGVKRISFAASLYRASVTGLLHAALEAKDKGTFGYLDHAMTSAELNMRLGEWGVAQIPGDFDARQTAGPKSC
jgi:2-methylisocitrate lyase-like PEP mutase family enzyme